MNGRQAVRGLVCCVVAAAGCSGDHAAGPTPLPTCSSASTVATHVTLAVGAYMAIDPASDSGCAVFPANASALDSAEYLLVPQSAAGTFGDSSLFQLRGGALSAATVLAQRQPPPPGRRGAALQFDGFLRRVGRTRAPPAAPGAQPAAGPPVTQPLAAGPPSVGSPGRFVVCANLTCTKFDTVGAKATTVGAHIAIYVDTLAPKAGLDSADLDTLKQVFDTLLYPLDTATFGRVSDIDSNHVVIVLMTGVVNSLVTRTMCESSGFVAGFFFPPDLDTTAPRSSSNHGEIFYSIVADPDSTLSCPHTRAGVKRELPGTFTHEFQHMINFAEHVLFRPGIDTEEGWLDEGLSKYAEELAGRSYLQQGDTNTFSQYAIDDVYDAYQYLSATGASPLLIEFDQGTLAEIGASWLFVRYLVDQFGPALPGKLDQTTLVGSANVAAQTGQSFTTTVTQWALANWVSDLPGFSAPPELTYTSWHFRKTYASLNVQDPQHFPAPYPLVPFTAAGSSVNLSGTIRSGSGVYQRALQGPSAPGFTLLFTPTGGTAFAPAVVARLGAIRIR